MDDSPTLDALPTLLAGRVSDVGPTYVVLGKTRTELDHGQGPAAFQVGYSVAVMAVASEGRYIGGSIVSPEALDQLTP